MWREELSYLAERKPWRDSLVFLKNAVAENPASAEVYVGAIYFLIDLLLEGPVQGRIDFVREADEIAVEIKGFFDESHKQFSENAEYLFFVGYFMALTDWYFGGDILETSRQMRRKATEIDPDNMLYEWALLSSTDDLVRKNDLARKILSDSEKIDWLKLRGAAGDYMIEVLKQT
jgi:hypothetical protein